MRDRIITFISDLLSVILGIIITFAIQGKVDRAADRGNVRAALELVRTELQTNMEDIGIMVDHLVQEGASAKYILDHRFDLGACPKDSLDYHVGVIFAGVSITTCQDALELLKMSSLFQKIGDNPLSMKIIRAYDSCTYIAADLNRHISVRDARYTGEITREYVLPLATMANMDLLTDVTDLETAITAIDDYLKKR